MGASNTDTAQQARSAAETAGQEGRDLAQSTADSTKQVAQTAKEEGRNVVQEATGQARNLADQARSEVTTQANQQRQRLAGTLRNSGQELSQFADRDAQSPLTTELARRAGQYAQSIGDYMERADPQRMLDDVRSFARRRPGTFLLIAAASGVVAGRLTRGVTAAAQGDQSTGSRRTTVGSTDGQALTSPPPPVGDAGGMPTPPPPFGEPGVLPTPPPPVVDPGASGRGGTGLAGERFPDRPDVLP